MSATLPAKKKETTPMATEPCKKTRTVLNNMKNSICATTKSNDKNHGNNIKENSNINDDVGFVVTGDHHSSSNSLPVENLSLEFDLVVNQKKTHHYDSRNNNKKKKYSCDYDDGDDQNTNDDDGEHYSSSNCSYSSISTDRDHGVWDGDDTPWKGCVCGKTHPKPNDVFWIQCDGPCQSWYNVAVKCVGFDSRYATKSISTWTCPSKTCNVNTIQNKNNLTLKLFLDLPDVLLYHIIGYCAQPTDRVIVLCTQIAPLCSATQYAVNHDPSWSGLWSLLFRQEYIIKSNNLEERPIQKHQKSRRSSRKRHQRRRPTSGNDAKDQVMEAHLSLCAQTDDAHMALSTLVESKYNPLSLRRLRFIFLGDTTASTTRSSLPCGTAYSSPLRVNRRSPFAGRTFLQVCCAADYVDERVVLRSIKELIEKHGADPNIFTTSESPYADRPVLFFAISRAMPSVVRYLIGSRGDDNTFVPKANTSVIVNGTFRYISDPSKTFSGSFTPLRFAQELWNVEQQQLSVTLSSSKSHKQLQPYWASKLTTCISVLSEEANLDI